MGLWRRVEEKVWLGKVKRDYGTISDETAHRTVSVLLAGKGEPQLVIKEKWRVWFLGGSVRYTPLDRNSVERLDMIIHDALSRMTSE